MYYSKKVNHNCPTKGKENKTLLFKQSESKPFYSRNFNQNRIFKGKRIKVLPFKERRSKRYYSNKGNVKNFIKQVILDIKFKWDPSIYINNGRSLVVCPLELSSDQVSSNSKERS